MKSGWASNDWGVNLEMYPLFDFHQVKIALYYCK